MKCIKRLICTLLVFCIAASLCGCSKEDFLLDLTLPEEKSQEAIDFEVMDKAQKIELLVSKMKQAFANGEKTVSFGFDCSEYLFDAYQIVYTDCPEHFWLTRSSSYEKSKTEVNTTIVFKPKVFLSDLEIQTMQSEIDAATQRILSNLKKDATDYEKVLYLHDYIVDNTVYDTESADMILNKEEDIPQKNRNSTGIYGCLVKGQAICSGYSAAFKYLADKLGLAGIRVSGTNKITNESHQWNCVKVDGDFYYIDLTWDDKLSENPNEHLRDYEYFLLNDEDLRLTHTISEGQNVPSCTATKYNYFVYNGLYMEKYDFVTFLNLLSSKLPVKEISFKFGSATECKKAYDELFEVDRMFWFIPGITDTSVMAGISDSGKILNIEL